MSNTANTDDDGGAPDALLLAALDKFEARPDRTPFKLARGEARPGVPTEKKRRRLFPPTAIAPSELEVAEAATAAATAARSVSRRSAAAACAGAVAIDCPLCGCDSCTECRNGRQLFRNSCTTHHTHTTHTQTRRTTMPPPTEPGDAVCGLALTSVVQQLAGIEHCARHADEWDAMDWYPLATVPLQIRRIVHKKHKKQLDRLALATFMRGNGATADQITHQVFFGSQYDRAARQQVRYVVTEFDRRTLKGEWHDMTTRLRTSFSAPSPQYRAWWRKST